MHLQRGTTTDIFFTIAVTISAPSPFVCCSASPSQLAAAANKNGSPQFAFRDGMRRSTVTCFNPFLPLFSDKNGYHSCFCLFASEGVVK